MQDLKQANTCVARAVIALLSNRRGQRLPRTTLAMESCHAGDKQNEHVEFFSDKHSMALR